LQQNPITKIVTIKDYKKVDKDDHMKKLEGSI